MGNLSDKSTHQLMVRMQPHINAIYRAVYPGCEVSNLRGTNGNAHVLDQYYGIDTIITLENGAILTVQEKTRDASCRHYRDFTQGYTSGYGTQHEGPGEWFKLEADLYFYGWANEEKSGYTEWFLMNVVAYKRMVSEMGGWPLFGKLILNDRHGKTLAYGADALLFEPCFEHDWRTVENCRHIPFWRDDASGCEMSLADRDAAYMEYLFS